MSEDSMFPTPVDGSDYGSSKCTPCAPCAACAACEVCPTPPPCPLPASAAQKGLLAMAIITSVLLVVGIAVAIIANSTVEGYRKHSLPSGMTVTTDGVEFSVPLVASKGLKLSAGSAPLVFTGATVTGDLTTNNLTSEGHIIANNVVLAADTTSGKASNLQADTANIGFLTVTGSMEVQTAEFKDGNQNKYVTISPTSGVKVNGPVEATSFSPTPSS